MRELTRSQAAVLETLAGLGAGSGYVKAAQRDLAELTDYRATTVGRALTQLEAAGYVEAHRPSNQMLATKVRLTEKGTLSGSNQGGGFDALPDCFRAPDLKAPGWMWKRAEKGREYTLKELQPIASAKAAPTLRKHLAVLKELGAVTLKMDGRLRIVVFNELDDAAQAAILAALNERATQWRPKTRAELAARHERERDAAYFRLGNTDQHYANALPDMLGMSERNERGCRVYHGPLDKDGYSLLPGQSAVGRGHRAAYRVMVGPIPEGRQVHHACNERPCLESDHLLAVTKAQHDWYTSAHGVESRQGPMIVAECREHGERIAYGFPAPPRELFPCRDCQLYYVTTILPKSWEDVNPAILSALHENGGYVVIDDVTLDLAA